MSVKSIHGSQFSLEKDDASDPPKYNLRVSSDLRVLLQKTDVTDGVGWVEHEGSWVIAYSVDNEKLVGAKSDTECKG